MGRFDLPVAVIGAGPFGVSTAAYLRSCGVEFRIFGSPMSRWLTQMPAGMFLKSDGFASSLADPAGHYTLQQFCDQAALPYANVPVSLETFTRYAVSFQQNLVPMVEDVLVTKLDRQSNGFELRLATGEEVRAAKVVVATGLSHAAYTPAALATLPAELLSHSSEHDDLGKFKGREIIVIGGGQSALETAALLNERQARVSLLIRRLIKAIPYVGIMDIDYRFDKRDGQYKLLDFNPRIGAQFRLFEDSERIDVARALYRDLTGQSVRRSPQIDGRVFVVEPHDCLTSIHSLWRGELSFRDWWRSFKGGREFAWFRWNDPVPFIMIWIRLGMVSIAKAVRVLQFPFLRSQPAQRALK